MKRSTTYELLIWSSCLGLLSACGGPSGTSSSSADRSGSLDALGIARANEAPGKVIKPSCGYKAVSVGGRVLVGDASTKAEEVVSLGGSSASLPLGKNADDAETEDEKWVHAYDLLDDSGNIRPSWTKLQLSEPRHGLAMVTVGDKVLVAGGASPGRDFFPGAPYDWKKHQRAVVDVYDHKQKAFIKTMQLSEPRSYAWAISAGNKAYIISGFNGHTGPFGGLHESGVDYWRSDVVDIYDSTTDQWHAEKLLRANQIMRVSVINGRVALSRSYEWEGDYEFFDPVTGEHGIAQVSFNKTRFGVSLNLPSLLARFDDYWVMSGFLASGAGVREDLEIYNETSKTWRSIILPYSGIGYVSARGGDSVVFGGGEYIDVGPDRKRTSQSGAFIVNPVTGVTTPTTLSVERAKMIGISVLGKYALFIGGTTSTESTAVIDVYDGANHRWLYENGAVRKSVQLWSSNDDGAPKDREAIYGSDLSFVPNPSANEVRIYRANRAQKSFTLIQTLSNVGNYPQNAYRVPGTNTLVVASVYSSSLSVFRIGSDSVLREAPSSPYKLSGLEQPSAPGYSVADDILYVPSYKTKAYLGFRVSDTGVLTPIDQSSFSGFPYKLSQFNPIPDGRGLYAVDPVSGYLTSFGMYILWGQLGGIYTGLTQTAPAIEPWDVALMPWESWSKQRWFAYVGLSQAEKIGIYNVNPIYGGLAPLKEVTPTRYKAANRTVPMESGFSDDGTELYFVDRGIGTVLRFQVNTSTGDLTDRTPLPIDINDVSQLEKCKKIGC